jgi:hypothetical protein
MMGYTCPQRKENFQNKQKMLKIRLTTDRTKRWTDPKREAGAKGKSSQKAQKPDCA